MKCLKKINKKALKYVRSQTVLLVSMKTGFVGLAVEGSYHKQ